MFTSMALLSVLVSNGQLSAQSPPLTPLSDGLSYYYPLTADATNAVGGLNGQLIFGAYFTNALPTPFSQAVWLNGTGAMVYVGPDNLHDPGQVVSWSAWVFLARLNEAVILYDGDSSYGADRLMRMDADGTVYEEDIDIYGNGRDLFGIKLTTNRWTQVAFTADLGHKSLFVNGLRVATTNVPLPNLAGKSLLTFGSGYLNGNPYIGSIQGAISKVRIYNRSLSDAEIHGLYLYESSSGPRPASAVATVVNGFVVGASVVDSGSGYTNPPAVSFYGVGTGATATATVTNGGVISIAIDNPGKNYAATGTLVVVAAPPSTPPILARAVSTVAKGGVTSVTMTDLGFGYETPPVVVFLGGGGTGAQGIATVINGRVAGITITDPGTGYTSAPTVAISSAGLSGLLDIQLSKVRITTGVLVGHRYRLVSSPNLSVWTPIGDDFTADQSVFIQELEASTAARYYALVELP